MSDLFEEDEDNVVEVGEDFDLDNDLDIDADAEVMETVPHGLDARRRLENMLDEKRLRDELDDFGDY
ncbi:PA3496 family putative envelope integrity protein [Legionella cincinnatiensis]|uniref:Uncharacterized protein n=1 Tax=Legionella cincinnatiensis TaxID=28085 RepID=A0A378INC7_9GAMM|nr:hypothetical protein [Legionella cincinnatiensis]KTC83873.1 hypothetical protein Lcin_1953 [Legionella cincinnatiensis]STX36165.1 Uncharacterised protein [Legionella cincinnatiensis]